MDALIGTWNMAGTSRRREGLRGRVGPQAGGDGIHAIYASIATGFVSVTGNERIDELFSRAGIGLNAIAGDQHVAVVLPSRMFRREFARRGLAPQVSSRAVEDSGTVTSVLVPWNICGAYISGVLSVQTAAYLPFCFFNFLNPVLDALFGFIGFKAPTISAAEQLIDSPDGENAMARVPDLFHPRGPRVR